MFIKLWTPRIDEMLQVQEYNEYPCCLTALISVKSLELSKAQNCYWVTSERRHLQLLKLK